MIRTVSGSRSTQIIYLACRVSQTLVIKVQMYSRSLVPVITTSRLFGYNDVGGHWHQLGWLFPRGFGATQLRPAPKFKPGTMTTSIDSGIERSIFSAIKRPLQDALLSGRCVSSNVVVSWHAKFMNYDSCRNVIIVNQTEVNFKTETGYICRGSRALPVSSWTLSYGTHQMCFRWFDP
jgi:hypothetical protein